MKAILVVIAESEHADFVMIALRGAFRCAAVLEGKELVAYVSLLKQGITVITKMPREQAVRVKAHFVVFPEGSGRASKKHWLDWKPTDSIEERDKIVEEALLHLRRRKLIKAL